MASQDLLAQRPDVSSAYWITADFILESVPVNTSPGKSPVRIINNNGARMLPWGTPKLFGRTSGVPLNLLRAIAHIALQ